NDFDYEGAINEMKRNMKDSVPIYRFGIMIHKFVQNLGDGHAKVDEFESYLPRGFSPVKYGIYNDRIFAYKEGDSGLLDNNFPFVKSIDNVDAGLWMSTAGDIVSGRNAT